MAFFKNKKNNEETRTNEVEGLLIEGEEIKNKYQSLKEILFITNKRVIFQIHDLNFDDPKVNFISIPFDKIDSIGVAKRSTVSDIIIYSRGKEHKIKLVEKEANTSEIYKLLSEKIL